MIKKLLLASVLLAGSPVFAGPAFKYQTNCYLESQDQYQEDVCTVVETREKSGALKTRNIYSNRFGLTIKSWFDEKNGFMTWDSHNKFNYKWEYKIGGQKDLNAHTYVMPGFLLENVSWD
jgi:hypothetical protein